jgi:HAD superfamily hydrolase (TIGR01509 family)
MAGRDPLVQTVHDPAGAPPVLLPLLRPVQAVVFDTDGVIVDSTPLHAAAWKEAFDPCLAEAGQPPFDSGAEYLRWVDGKPRIVGAADLLAARGVRLPLGDTTDWPGTRSVHAVAARKEQAFVRRLAAAPVSASPGFLRLARVLVARGTVMAAVSSSRHARELLARAGVSDLFSTVVAGDDAARLRLPGKPSPALFLEACHRLGIPAARSAVVEDALAGVEAGRSGGFRLVVGLDHGDRPDHGSDLHAHGADLVVRGLGDLLAAAGSDGG